MAERAVILTAVAVSCNLLGGGRGAAVGAGGKLAHPPMEIPGHGTFAIYIQGGVHHGLWQR